MNEDENDVLPGQSSIFEYFDGNDTQAEYITAEQEVCAADQCIVEWQDIAAQQKQDDEFLAMSDGQLSFVDPDGWWKEHWREMPEFVQGNTEPWKTIYVHLRSSEDLNALGAVLEQRISEKTKSIWFPALEKVNRICMGYVEEA